MNQAARRAFGVNLTFRHIQCFFEILASHRLPSSPGSRTHQAILPTKELMGGPETDFRGQTRKYVQILQETVTENHRTMTTMLKWMTCYQYKYGH